MTLQPHRYLVFLYAASLLLAAVIPARAATPASGVISQDAATRPLVMAASAAESESTRPVAGGPFQAQERLGPPSATTPRAAAPIAGTPGAANSSLLREVFGFVNAGNLGNATYGYPSWNYSLLTTVTYFGLQVNSGDGAIVQSGAEWTVWNSSTTSSFIARAHQNGTRVLVSINLQDFASGTPEMCAGLTHTSATISQTLQQVQSHGVDGVNVDYEGLNGACGTTDPNKARELLTTFLQNLRTALPSYYIAQDTYASSAGDPRGFYDIPNLAPSVDSFFVMAYDSDWSNYSRLGCTSYCLNPVSPAGGSYYYNDTRAAAEYTAAVPASKVILGLPYYSRGACVSSWAPNQYPAPGQGTYALPYRTSVKMATDPTNTGYVLHRDANDPAGMDAWSTWTSTNTTCKPMELYWDDAAAMGAKYDVVNNYNLRGAGLFALDMAGSAPELWDQLATHFSLIPLSPTSVSACAGDGSATISWSPPPYNGASVNGYTVTASPGGASVTVWSRATWAPLQGLTDGIPYTFTVTASNQYGKGIASAPSNATTPAPPAVAWPGQLKLLSAPHRLIDTRIGTGGQRTFGGGQAAEVTVLGQAGIPATGVAGVVINLTATNATNPGYLTAFPGAGCHNVTSNLNFGTGNTVASLVYAALGSDGRIAIQNGSLGSVDVIADVVGWIADAGATSGGAGRFAPTGPSRLLDTRAGAAPSKLPGGQSLAIPVTSHAGVPAAGVLAVLVNLTVTDTASPGFLVAYPGSTPPLASNVNFSGGQTVANRSLVLLDGQGRISVYNGSPSSVDVVIDVVGWFSDASSAATGGTFTGISTLRVLDSRTGAGGYASPIGPRSVAALARSQLIGLPTSGVTAVVLNVTVTDTTSAGYIAAYPGLTTVSTSDLNFAGQTTSANLVVVPVGADGNIDFLNGSAGSVDLIADLVGWYGP